MRYLVLGSAIAIFVLTVGPAACGEPPVLVLFTYWYALALLLLRPDCRHYDRVGPRRLLSWTGRAAQFLSGAYMFIAALASMRESARGG